MSKVALYEHGEGKTTLRLNKYYKNDFSTANLLSGVPLGIVTGLLLMVLIFIGEPDWVIKSYEAIGGTASVLLLLGCFILFVVGYSFFALSMNNHKYDHFRGNLRSYSLNLRRLNKVYEEEQQERQNPPEN